MAVAYELTGWTGVNAEYTCGGSLTPPEVIGGKSNIGLEDQISRVFGTTDPHYGLEVSFSFFTFGVWDPSEYVRIIIDGLHLDTIKDTDARMVSGLCGDSTPYKRVSLTYYVKHSSNTLALKFESKLTQAKVTASWGFQSFTVTTLKCPPNCVSCYNSFTCFACQIGSKTFIGSAPIEFGKVSQGVLLKTTGNLCQCYIGYYADSTSCKRCHPRCGSCSGPLVTNCIYSREGRPFFSFGILLDGKLH